MALNGETIALEIWCHQENTATSVELSLLMPTGPSQLHTVLMDSKFYLNPYLPSGLFHPCQLDMSISKFRDV